MMNEPKGRGPFFPADRISIDFPEKAIHSAEGAFDVVVSPLMPRDQAMMMGGPLRVIGSQALRDFIAADGSFDINIKDDVIEFGSPDCAAMALTLAEMTGVITHDEGLQLITAAAQELATNGRAVVLKNIGEGDDDG